MSTEDKELLDQIIKAEMKAKNGYELATMILVLVKKYIKKQKA